MALVCYGGKAEAKKWQISSGGSFLVLVACRIPN
jgi:hypothetical protein